MTTKVEKPYDYQGISPDWNIRVCPSCHRTHHTHTFKELALYLKHVIQCGETEIDYDHRFHI